MNPKRSSMRAMIVGGATLVVATLLCAVAFVTSQNHDLALERAKKEIERSATAAEATMNRLLLSVDAGLVTQAARVARVGDGVERLTAVRARDLLNDGYTEGNVARDMLLVRSDGAIVGSIRRAPRDARLPDGVAPGFARAAVGTAGLVGPTRNPLTGDWVLHMSRSVPGARLWVVAELPISALMATLAPVVDQPGLSVAIRAADRALIASIPHEELLIGQPHAGPVPGSIAAERDLLHGGTRLAMVMDRDAALSAWAHERNTIFVGLALVLALFLALVALLLQGLSRRLQVERERRRMQQMLEDAIEAMPGGFVVWDADERFVICNRRYRDMYARSAGALVPGSSIRDILRHGALNGQYGAIDDVDAFVASVHASWRSNAGALERALPDGRHVLASERQTRGGGRVGVRTDITELKRQEQLIQQYNIALERFSYVASHDLQEPLRKVVTHARLLEQALRDGDDAEVARCLDVLKASGERGRDLVRSLLDFARLKDSSITRVPLTLLDLAREVVARFVDEVAAGKARITIDGDPFEVSADRTLLTQVLHNLIGNAVKYRPPGEPARVRVATAIDPRSRAANIVVADEGIGFDMAHAAKLFEPFQRLVARCDYAGTGIGLSLVKAILDKHGWTIDVHATPGVGARFTIAIPARDVVAPPATTWAHAA